MGNRLHRKGENGSDTGYLWDDMGRLVSYTISGGQPYIVPQTHTYTYRADGMRVTKLNNYGASYETPDEESGTWDPVLAENLPTTRYLYDGQMCAMEDFSRYLGGTAMAEDLTRYGLGARGIDVVERKPSISLPCSHAVAANVPSRRSRRGIQRPTEFPIYDAHGNNIARLKRSGSNGYTVSNLRSYDAWGSVRSGVPSGNPTQRYCANLGHVQDDESGLVYMRARYYEPATGRFISEDPARDGLNWYVYCSNDPVGRVDRGGMSDEDAHRFVVLGGGAFGLVQMLAGAAISSIARAAAINSAVFLLIWFTGDGRSFNIDEDQGLTRRLVVGGATMTILGVLAQVGAPTPKPGDGSPTSHLIGICLQHSGFLVTFMVLEDIASCGA